MDKLQPPAQPDIKKGSGDNFSIELLVLGFSQAYQFILKNKWFDSIVAL